MRNDDPASKAFWRRVGAVRNGGERGNIGIGRGGRTWRYDVTAAAEARSKLCPRLASAKPTCAEAGPVAEMAQKIRIASALFVFKLPEILAFCLSVGVRPRRS